MAPKIYLAGRMFDLPDSGETWREKITPFLEEFGLDVQNPADLNEIALGETCETIRKQIDRLKYYNLFDNVEDIMTIIWREDIRAVKASHYLLAYIADYSVGTSAELAIHYYHRPVGKRYVVTPIPRHELNELILLFASRIFSSFAEFKKYMRVHYG